MSAPPGAFENSGGVQPPNGSGQQPAKRPKMDDQLRNDGPQQGGPQSGGGSNPLDSIFPDSGGGGMALPDELMNRNQQSTPVSQQKQMPNNGATQLQQGWGPFNPLEGKNDYSNSYSNLLHPQSNPIVSQPMVNNQFRNQMNQPMTSMAPGMPVSSPMMGRPLAASPSPNTPGAYPVRSPAPNGGPGRVTPGPHTGPVGPNGQPQGPPGQFGMPGPNQGGMGNHFTQFPNNPQPGNSQSHVQKLLGNVNQQNMVQGRMNPGMPGNMQNMRPPMHMGQPGNMNPGNMNAHYMMNNHQQIMRPNMNQYPVPRPNQPGMNAQNMGNQPQQQQQPPQQQAPNQPTQNNQQMPGQNQSGQSIGASDPDKRKMIQNQLIILIHAAKCQKRTDGDGSQQQCNIPHCQTMKNVLLHLPNCQMGRNCTIQHCASSRQIIAHWKQCKRPDCAVCQPLKPPQNQPNANQPTGGPTGPGPEAPTGGPGPEAPKQPTDNSTPKPNQPDWRTEVNQELREHLVKKLVSAIFPTTDSNERNSNDDRIKKLYNFARKVEEDMYNKASTREEYYHMLAEKIYKIQKELEAKRQKDNKDPNAQSHPNQSQMPNQPGMNPGFQQTPGQNNPMFGNQNPWNQQQAPQQQQQQQQQQSGNFQQNQWNQQRMPNQMPNPMMQGNQMGQMPQQQQQTLQQQQQQQQVNPAHLQQTKMEPKSEIKTEPGLMEPKKEFGQDSSVGRSIESDQSPTPPPEKKQRKEEPEEKKPIIKQEQSEDVKPNPEDLKPNAKNFKVWTKESLTQMLMPVWKTVFDHVDAHPFHHPVDYVFLQLPEYPNIVQHPMDMNTIREKLEGGQYNDPWGFVDDFWLMFNNAWLFNKKNTKVYRMCTALNKCFLAACDPVMKKAGYCCAQKLTFTALPLCCYGKTTCTINVGAYYYVHQNTASGPMDGLNVGNDKIFYCEKCFTDARGNEIGSDSGQKIPKTKFTRKRNDEKDPEVMLACTDCGRKSHEICVLHKKEIFQEKYTCEHCLRAKKSKRKENVFTASKLPECTLSKHIEHRVNTMISNADQKDEAGHVFIRVVFVGDKAVETRSGVRKEGSNVNTTVAEKYKYRAKAMFAFEQIDNVDVCFFGLHVQEYGSECPNPNNRRVYIGYLDSVKFFQPAHLRTSVYHELLISYLDFTRKMGFVWAHIWACPPSEGDDYIFHCHPPEQKVPKAKRLQDWYKMMLQKAQERQAIVEFKDIYRQAKDDNVTNVTQMPYFDGDFWPNAIEDLIVEVEKEQQQDAANDARDDSSNPHDSKSKSKVQKKNQMKKKRAGDRQQSLMEKVMYLMERHKDVFFVIRMIEKEKVPSLPKIQDPDEDMQCDLMDGRDPFLTKARDEHWEFSSLRRAKFSTMCLLHKLHNPDKTGQFGAQEEYSCNECQTVMTTRYRCKECSDYDLCTKCYEEQQKGTKEKHPHPLVRVGASGGLPGFGADGGDQSSQDRKQNRQSIDKCISGLSHAVKCRDANCTKNTCSKMKRVINHTKNCSKKGRGLKCNICRQFIALCCYHAKRCEERNCRIPYCSQIKTRLAAQREATRQREAQLMKRRMMLTNSSMDDEPPTPQAPQTPNPGQPGTPQPNMGGGGGKNGAGSKIGSKGMSTPQMGPGGGGKMGGQMHPFSPQTPNQGFMNQQQHPMVSNQTHVPPAGAVIAAQEVVDIATRQISTPSNNVGNSKPQPYIRPVHPSQNGMTGINNMSNISQPFNMNSAQVMNQQQQNQQQNQMGQQNYMQSNPNYGPRPPGQNSFMPNGQNMETKAVINMIRNNDPKDPQVLEALKKNPQMTATLLANRNQSNMPPNSMNMNVMQGGRMIQQRTAMNPGQNAGYNQPGMMMPNQWNNRMQQNQRGMQKVGNNPNMNMQVPAMNMAQGGVYRMQTGMQNNVRPMNQPYRPPGNFQVNNMNNMNQNMNMNMNTNPSMNNGMMMNGGMGNMGQMGNNQPMQPNHMQQNQQRQMVNPHMGQGNYRPTQVSQNSQMMSQHGQSGPILMNTSGDQNQLMSNPHNNPSGMPGGGPMSNDNDINNYKQIIDKL